MDQPVPLVQRVVDHVGPLVQHRLDEAAYLVRGGWTTCRTDAIPLTDPTNLVHEPGPKPDRWSGGRTWTEH